MVEANKDSVQKNALKEALHIEYVEKLHQLRLIRLVCILLIFLFGAGIIVSGIVFPKEKDVVVSDGQLIKYDQPCIEAGIKPSNPSAVHVRVLNGTGRSGLADAVSKALSNRSFSTHTPDSSDFETNDTQIRFGINNIADAYTLALHFNNPLMIMDDREDYLVDVVVGKTFYDLVSVDALKNNNTDWTLESPAGCIPANKVSLEPEIEHEPIEKTADDTIAN